MEYHIMNKAVFHLLSYIILLAAAAPASAKSVTNISTPGVYVVDSKGYVKVEPYAHDYQFVDFNYANEIPFAKRSSDTLKLVVYQKDFDENSIALELRPLNVKVTLQKVKFSVKTMDKPDMYELVADIPVKDGAILQVKSWAFFDNMGVVMMGNTEEELVRFFSQKDMPNASTVTQYLDDSLVAFPDSAQLKSLSKYWKDAAATEKDREAYTYVDEKWQKYEQAEKLTLKQRYLEAAVVEINGYLNEHPQGINASEAKKRLATAEEKLKEYEKLL